MKRKMKKAHGRRNGALAEQGKRGRETEEAETLAEKRIRGRGETKKEEDATRHRSHQETEEAEMASRARAAEIRRRDEAPALGEAQKEERKGRHEARRREHSQSKERE
jgi:hypothetical protein